MEHFWLGMMVILVSGTLNGNFAVPMKYSRWRWENTWLAFTASSLVLLPWLLAAVFVPHLKETYGSVPGSALLLPALFGFLWGIAQVTFGIAIRTVGMALAFAVVSGLGCLIGSLVPILAFNPGDLFRPRGLLLLASLPILLPGLYLYALAGRRREKEQAAVGTVCLAPPGHFLFGFLIAIFTGIFGANLNIGFAFGRGLIERSVELGVSPATSTYAVWALVLSTGFIPNLAYCAYLLFRNRAWSSFVAPRSAREYALALAMALLWLGGMVFYGIGTTVVGRYGTSIGFALYCASIILSANVGGILVGEWRASSAKTLRFLGLGMTAILLAIVVLNLGGLFP